MLYRIIFLISLFLLASGCEFYRVFEENKSVNDFLNGHFKQWVVDESIIHAEFNQLIAGEQFDAVNLYNELDKKLIPFVLRLRESISKAKLGKKSLISIQNLFIDKMDLMLEGFDMIKEGLSSESEEEDKSDLLYRGRDKLKEVNQINLEIDSQVQELLKEYYIRIKMEGNPGINSSSQNHSSKVYSKAFSTNSSAAASIHTSSSSVSKPNN